MSPSIFTDIVARVRTRTSSDASRTSVASHHTKPPSVRSVSSSLKSSLSRANPFANIARRISIKRNSTLSSVPEPTMAKHSRKRAQANGAGSSRTSSTAGGGYRSYTVHKQSAAPAILRDADATQKMMDYIGDGAAGKRGLARLARTCKAFCEPALNALWRELDSLVPLIGLFPSTLLRRAKRPGLGLAKEPVEEDWKKVLEYGERVESVRYVESFNNVSPSIFPVIEETRPREYILPNLKSLSWRVDTPAGLDRSLLFIHPRIEAVNLDIGIRITKIDDFIVKMTERTRLKEFSLVATGSTANLPDGFTDMMRSQMKLQKLTLSVPGTVSSAVGKWIASLPHLRSLQLDLSGRPNSAVEQFFSEMHAVQVGSGLSTPESVGAESGDDASVDFKDIRKSALRVVSSPLYARKIGPYSQLRELHLTGSAGGLAVFLRKLPMCEIVNLELVIEDPPEKGEWRQLLNSLCGRVGNALQSLKFSATGASKFPELVRSTSRGDVVGPTRRLPLEGLTTLPQVRRLEFDLPTSIIFTDEDVERLAIACPALEQLKLCPTARFPLSGEAPALTLEGVAALTTHCYYLHTLHAVINAAGASDAVLASRFVSSKSLLRLHFGHSWITDPLQAAICLSHIAPYLESLRWFHEKNRPGYIEVHAQGWQQTSDFLPHLQKLRLMERDAVVEEMTVQQHIFPVHPPAPQPPVLSLPVQDAQREPEDFELVPAREFAEKAVDARPITVNQEVFAEPETLNEGVQFCPACVEEAVQAETPLESVSVQAEPTLQSTYVDATLIFSDKESQGSPTLTHRSIDPESPTLPKPVLPMTDDLPTDKLSEAQSETTSDTSMSSDPGDVRHHPSYFPVSSIFHIFAAMRELFIAPPLLLSLWLMSRSLATIGATRIYTTQEVMHVDEEEEKEGHDSENPAAEGPLKEATDATMVTASEAVSPVMTSYDSHETIRHVEALDGLETKRDVAEQEKRLDRANEVPRDWLHELVTTLYARPSRVRNSAIAAASHTESYYIMSEKKQERDFTPEVDTLLPEATSLAESGKLQESLDKLFALEKQTRNASDLKSTTRLVKTVSELCYNARDYTLLNSSIATLSKKHGQLKGAVQALVEQAMGWLPEIRQRDGDEKWLELIETLRAVTEGKIFLETPRARVTLLLAHHHESLAEPSKAATAKATPKESLVAASELLSELQVETYSSMERREKTEFILEQMRLLIAVARVKDAEKEKEEKGSSSGGEAEWIKARVGGRKINEEFLKEKENEDLKLKYYDLMIQHALHHSSYLDAAKYYHKVWETPSVKEDENDKGKSALEHIVYYVVLAPHDNEQSDMLHRLFADPALSKPKLELQYNLVKCFTTQELMRWPGIESLYGPFLRKTHVFETEKHWEALHDRVIEHNIRVVARYYTRITLERLTSLLDLSRQQTEETLSRLVVSGSVWARIDRPAGIVSFRAKRSPEDIMNDWSSDMQKLLGTVEKTWMQMNAAQAAQSKIKV